MMVGGFGASDNRPQYATGQQPISVVVADFNGDGKADLVTANNYAQHGVSATGCLEGQVMPTALLQSPLAVTICV